MIKRSTLLVTNKLGYIRGHARPPVKCILCGVVQRDPRVESLEIYRTRRILVSLNLYPYSPGHLLILPLRHCTDIRELTAAEQRELLAAQGHCLSLVEQVYQPRGFNIGYNQGESSGASIDHLHLHIVPRYRNEVGFIDVIGGARVIVQDPHETAAGLRAAHRALQRAPSRRRRNAS
ncbi:MAG TPA: HIT domain-containing protein [bacterium]|nr:HIT domain-containing protein [bacterium]